MLFRVAVPAVMLVAVAGLRSWPPRRWRRPRDGSRLRSRSDGAQSEIDPTSLPMKVLNDHTRSGPTSRTSE